MTIHSSMRNGLLEKSEELGKLIYREPKITVENESVNAVVNTLNALLSPYGHELDYMGKRKNLYLFGSLAHKVEGNSQKGQELDHSCGPASMMADSRSYIHSKYFF